MSDPVEIHGDAVAGQSSALRKRMRLLAGDLAKYTIDLAEALLQAQETHCYLQWGFESLPEYAELELGLKPRKSQYLARIARVCRDAGVARADYERVEITKLRSITSLSIKDTFYNRDKKKHEPMVEYIVHLIAEAPELSTAEVDEEVARLKGLTGENAMLTRSYSVTRSAYENTIQRCFESIRKRLGSAGRDETGKAKEYTDGNVIEALCAEWNGDPRNFLEESDESRVQIEVEESNVCRERALDNVACEEVLREQLQEPGKPLVVRAEE